MRFKKNVGVAMCLLLMGSCSSFKESAKWELNNGYYKEKAKGKDRRVYVLATEDTLVAYPLIGRGEAVQLDTSAAAAQVYPEMAEGVIPDSRTYHEYSFDLDVLAILFKYRPEQQGHPPQLGTGYSGAVYAGYRTDRYRIAYDSTPIGIAQRKISHYGYSIGYFTGIGAEPVNPWVTKGIYADEYDGVVWLNGVAAIVGINNFTIGASVGVDYLLDSNRKIWIYQTKPWVGLVLGLNLN